MFKLVGLLTIFAISLFANIVDIELEIKKEKMLLDGKATIIAEKKGVMKINVDGIDIKSSSSSHKKEGNFLIFNVQEGEKIVIKYSKKLENFGVINNFYPQIDLLSIYNLKIKTPFGLESLSENIDMNQKLIKDGIEFSFYFPYYRESLSLLILDNFKVERDRVDDIAIYNYSDVNLTNLKDEIYKYKNLFGELPFKRLNIVSNLSGATFINPDNNLSKEIAKQYFKFYTYTKDSFVEFFSDYYFNSNKSDYRKSAIIRNDIDFMALAVFEHISKDKFDVVVKDFLKEFRFKRATLEDFKLSVQKITKEQLINFALDRFIDLEIKNITHEYIHGKVKISFETTIDNLNSFYLPIKLKFDARVEDRDILISTKNQIVELILDELPNSIVFDGEYKLNRLLKEDEKTPIIANLFDDDYIIVYSSKELYDGVIKFLNKKAIFIDEVTYKDLKNSILILDRETQLIKDLIGKLNFGANLSIELFKNPFNNQKFIAVLDALNSNYSNELEKLTNYKDKSSVEFYSDRVETNCKNSKNGLEIVFKKPAIAYSNENRMSVENLIPKIENRQLIFVGEEHTNRFHHLTQLSIIKELYYKNSDLAIGLEAFEREYQDILNSYLAGELSESDFLNLTKYSQSFGYDFELYKPILEFAKLGKIEVIALNAKRDIVKKVAKDGFLNLTKYERDSISKEVNLINEYYKESLMDIFKEHKMENFEQFYQAQTVWDETMAETISDFLKRSTKKMVVICGNEHIKKDAIPERVKRRVNVDYVTISQDSIKLDVDFIILSDY